ncbi:MAG: hypothetical protein HY002_19770 [Candidatus Rokubacteria bacterium]|nr:hypothetical protein [Candidatus Rokubacteria bacterium]
MRAVVGPRRLWRWAAWLLAVAAVAQACGGDKSRSTGPTGPTEVTVKLAGLETALLPTNCTGVLSVTGAGLSLSAPIPADGRLQLVIPFGHFTFTVVLTCVKLDGTRSFTGQTEADVIPGQPLTLAIRVAVNEPPRVTSVSCNPSAVLTGDSTSCACRATDPDPADTLTFSWSSSGGGLSTTSGPNTQFSSSSGGTFNVTCAVSDGRATRAATTQVTVTAVGTIVIVNSSASTTLDGPVISGPQAYGPFSIAPLGSTTISNAPVGSYTALSGTYYSGASACPAFPFTVSQGATTTITYNATGSPLTCSVF